MIGESCSDRFGYAATVCYCCSTLQLPPGFHRKGTIRVGGLNPLSIFPTKATEVHFSRTWLISYFVNFYKGT